MQIQQLFGPKDALSTKAVGLKKPNEFPLDKTAKSGELPERNVSFEKRIEERQIKEDVKKLVKDIIGKLDKGRSTEEVAEEIQKAIDEIKPEEKESLKDAIQILQWLVDALLVESATPGNGSAVQKQEILDKIGTLLDKEKQLLKNMNVLEKLILVSNKIGEKSHGLKIETDVKNKPIELSEKEIAHLEKLQAEKTQQPKQVEGIKAADTDGSKPIEAQVPKAHGVLQTADTKISDKAAKTEASVEAGAPDSSVTEVIEEEAQTSVEKKDKTIEAKSTENRVKIEPKSTGNIEEPHLEVKEAKPKEAEQSDTKIVQKVEDSTLEPKPADDLATNASNLESDGVEPRLDIKVETHRVESAKSDSIVTPIRKLPQQLLNEIVSFHTSGIEGKKEVKIEISPPKLGNVLTTFEHVGDTVSIKIVAESNMVRNTLEQNLPQLKDLLEQQGIKVGNISVEIGSKDSNKNLGNEKSNQTSKISIAQSRFLQAEESEGDYLVDVGIVPANGYYGAGFEGISLRI